MSGRRFNPNAFLMPPVERGSERGRKNVNASVMPTPRKIIERGRMNINAFVMPALKKTAERSRMNRNAHLIPSISSTRVFNTVSQSPSRELTKKQAYDRLLAFNPGVNPAPSRGYEFSEEIDADDIIMGDANVPPSMVPQKKTSRIRQNPNLPKEPEKTSTLSSLMGLDRANPGSKNKRDDSSQQGDFVEPRRKVLLAETGKTFDLGAQSATFHPQPPPKINLQAIGHLGIDKMKEKVSSLAANMAESSNEEWKVYAQSMKNYMESIVLQANDPKWKNAVQHQMMKDTRFKDVTTPEGVLKDHKLLITLLGQYSKFKLPAKND
jgi:hypothetical protein